VIRRLVRWTAGILAAVLLLCAATVFWIMATENGTRWLVARASPLLPAALQITEMDGTLLRGVTLRSFSWNDETVGVSVDQLATQFQLLPLLRRQLRISNLDIHSVAVLVREGPPSDTESAPFSIDVPISILIENASVENLRVVAADRELVVDTVSLSGQLSGSALQIDRLDIQSELGDISLSGNGDLTGNYSATATAAWELRLPEQAAMSGILRLRGDASRYEIEHDLDAPYEISTRGTFAVIDGDVVADLANTWQRVRVETGDARAIDLVDGALRILGNTDEFAFDGSTTVMSDDIPPLELTTRGTRNAESLDFESVSVSNDWGKLLAKGGATMAPDPSWKFDFELSDLDPSVADQRLSGNLQITGRTSGRIADQLALADVRIDSINGDLNGYPVNGKGTLSYADEQIQFDSAVVRVGDNRVDFDGSYGQQLRMNAAVHFADISQFGIGASGNLAGDIRIVSDLKTIEASGSLNGENLAFEDYFVDKLSAEFDIPAQGMGNALLQVSDARFDDLMLATGRLSASGSAQAHVLDADFSLENGRGSLQLAGAIAGDNWSGAIRELALSGEQLGEWALREATDVSFSTSALKIGKACLVKTSTAGVACGVLDYALPGPLRFDVSVSEFPLAAFPVNLPEGATVEGAIAAHADGEYANQRLTANATLDVQKLGLRAIFEGDEVAVLFDRAVARGSVVDNRLSGELDFRLLDSVDHVGGDIDIADIFDQDSPLSGRGSLELNDLGLLSVFFPDLANPAGKIAGRVDVAGSLAAPEIIGNISLQGGSFGVRRAGIAVTDVALALRQAEAGHLALEGTARSGEGRLDIRGETALRSSSGIRTELSLNGEDFKLVHLPDWQVTASPAIAVVLDENATRVSGELGIPTANIRVHSVPETAARPSSDVIVYHEDEAVIAKQRTLYVDVRTSLGNDVLFSGFGLTTGLEGSVRIAGNSNSPYKSSGRVVLREGRYQAYGQNLEIESGELIFNGPLSNPALNIRATRTASDRTVAGIHVTGTPAQLKSQVYSEPALGDAEALSYLLTGRPLASADSEQGDMLNQAAFALGLTTAGSVASRIRNDLGFETLGVRGGSEDSQFVAGKRFGNRLFIEYAYGIIDNLGTLLLRYQLSNRLIVESRSGSVRNVDLVYSVKKR